MIVILSHSSITVCLYPSIPQLSIICLILDFRRGWADYQSTYLFAKFSTLLLVAVIDPNNCFFRSLSRTHVPIVRQILLLISTVGFFSAQSFFAPFLDPINNASEWTSRLNYILTSAVALGVALNIPGKDVFNTYVLYVFVFYPNAISHVAYIPFIAVSML